MRFTAFQESRFAGTAGGNALRASSRHMLRTAGRGRLETLAVPDHRPIFKLESDLRDSMGWKSICEAREACSCIPHESSRSECYAVFGLDGKRMDRYFASVYRMEQTLKKPAPSELVEEVEPVPEGQWQKLADRTKDAVIQSVINGLLQMLRGLGVTVPAADGWAAPPALSPRAEPESRTEAA